MTKSSLDLADLRRANKERLPQFKNSHGKPAHSKPDGSDWSPAQWFQALIGEIGELARVRVEYEDGRMGAVGFRRESCKEAADVQTYLDLLCQRVFDDINVWNRSSPAGILMRVVMHIGEYANARKKFERGDYDFQQYTLQRRQSLDGAMDALVRLRFASGLDERDHARDRVSLAHPDGVDLAQCTRDKFNEVSRRVGADVWL